MRIAMGESESFCVYGQDVLENGCASFGSSFTIT